MNKGWDASKYLPPLLARKGWTQEHLAEATGIGRGTINGYCTSRRDLGMKNAPRIAAALGVTLLELGAPATEADARGQSFLDLLEQVRVEAAAESLKLRKDLAAAVRRIRALERQVQLVSQSDPRTAEG